MENAIRDDNYVPVLLGVSSSDPTATLPFTIDSATGRLLVDLTGGGSGDVLAPATSADNSIARWDGTNGAQLAGSLATIDDNGSIDIPTGQSYKINGAALTTSNIAEGSNLYYTTARFDTALATKTTTNLTEGANLYYTDERVDDRINALFVEGFGIDFTYVDGSNTFTIAELVTPQTLTVTTNAVTPNAAYKQHYASHNANITINNPTNAADGKMILIGIKNTSGGAITVTGGSEFRFGTDITAFGSIAAGKINYYGARYHATDTKWDVISEIKGF